MNIYEMIEQTIEKFNNQYFPYMSFIEKNKMISIYIEYEELKRDQHYEPYLIMEKLCDNNCKDNIGKMIEELFNEINNVTFVDMYAAYDQYLHFIKTAIKYEKLKSN